MGPRILIKRKEALGDVILITPIVSALKQKWPQSVITVLTDYPEVFRNNPDARGLFSTPVLRADYDEFYDLDLAYENKPKQHIIQAYAKVCGVQVKDWRLKLFPNEGERQFVSSLLNPEKRWAIFHTGTTRWVGRDWGKEQFDEVSKALAKEGWGIVLVGNESTPSITCDHDLRGKTDLHQLAALMEQGSLFVGIDSGPMHVAQASLIPGVAIFGCTIPDFRLVPSQFVRGVSAENVDCLGCHHSLPPPRYKSECFRDRVYCMLLLTPEEVLKNIEVVLQLRGEGASKS